MVTIVGLEKRKYIERVFKYSKTDSILVIDKMGQLQRFQCPFEVVAISNVDEIYKRADMPCFSG
jgi:hypothetical protein